MWLTEDEQEEVRELLRLNARKDTNRKMYVRKELAFYHRIKEKYGEKIATAVLAKIWRTEGKNEGSLL